MWVFRGVVPWQQQGQKTASYKDTHLVFFGYCQCFFVWYCQCSVCYWSKILNCRRCRSKTSRQTSAQLQMDRFSKMCWCILRIIMVYQSDFRFWICLCSPISWRNLCQNATTTHNASTRPQSNPVGAPVVELPLTSPPQKYQKVMDLWRYTVSILTKQLSDRISDKRSGAFLDGGRYRIGSFHGAPPWLVAVHASAGVCHVVWQWWSISWRLSRKMWMRLAVFVCGIFRYLLEVSIFCACIYSKWTLPDDLRTSQCYL